MGKADARHTVRLCSISWRYADVRNVSLGDGSDVTAGYVVLTREPGDGNRERMSSISGEPLDE
jgi:hypothetical protein